MNSVKALLDSLDKIAAHGFDYFLACLGFILLLAGIYLRPQGPLSQQEILAILIFGIISLIASLCVWWHKVSLKQQANQEKIEYKKFLMDQRTKRYIAFENASDIPLNDLEEID